MLVPDAPRSVDRDSDITDAAPRRLAFVSAGGRDARVEDWENEGGRYFDEPELAGLSSEELPAGLDWYGFLEARFPGRRRHDLEPLRAYEAYRSSAEGGYAELTLR
jgi:hypothetical protein